MMRPALAQQAAILYSRNANATLKRLAKRNWPTRVDARMPRGMGELCRFTFIRDAEAGLTEQHFGALARSLRL
jgi:hypothetical protein